MTSPIYGTLSFLLDSDTLSLSVLIDPVLTFLLWFWYDEYTSRVFVFRKTGLGGDGINTPVEELWTAGGFSIIYLEIASVRESSLHVASNLKTLGRFKLVLNMRIIAVKRVGIWHIASEIWMRCSLPESQGLKSHSPYTYTVHPDMPDMMNCTASIETHIHDCISILDRDSPLIINTVPFPRQAPTIEDLQMAAPTASAA